MIFFSESNLLRDAYKYAIMPQLLTTDRLLGRICFSRVRNCEQQKWKVLGTENLRLVHKHQPNSAKITVWCGIHAKRVLDPYYVDNETAREADYYELLNTSVRSSRRSFPKNYLL